MSCMRYMALYLRQPQELCQDEGFEAKQNPCHGLGGMGFASVAFSYIPPSSSVVAASRAEGFAVPLIPFFALARAVASRCFRLVSACSRTSFAKRAHPLRSAARASASDANASRPSASKNSSLSPSGSRLRKVAPRSDSTASAVSSARSSRMAPPLASLTACAKVSSAPRSLPSAVLVLLCPMRTLSVSVWRTASSTATPAVRICSWMKGGRRLYISSEVFTAARMSASLYGFIGVSMSLLSIPPGMCASRDVLMWPSLDGRTMRPPRRDRSRLVHVGKSNTYLGPCNPFPKIFFRPVPLIYRRFSSN